MAVHWAIRSTRWCENLGQADDGYRTVGSSLR